MKLTNTDPTLLEMMITSPLFKSINSSILDNILRSRVGLISILLVSLLLLSGFKSSIVHAESVADSAGYTPQDTLYIDLYTALDIAMDQSPDAIRNAFTQQSAKMNLKAAKSEYFPQIDLSLLVPSINERQEEYKIVVPIDTLGTDSLENGDRFREVRRWAQTRNRVLQGELTFSQPLPTGGRIDLMSRFYQQFYQSDFSGVDDYDRERVQNYRLQVFQNFLRGNLLKIAKIRSELNYKRVSLSGSLTERQLAFQVTEAYYNLLLQEEELAISQDDLNASRETAELARRKFEAGLIAEVEALQLEVEVLQKEASLGSAVSALQTSLDRFRSQLGIDLDQPLRVIGDPEFDTIEVSEDEAMKLALERREELHQAEIDIKQAEISYDDARRPYKPLASVNAFYDLERRTETWEENLNSSADDFSRNRGVSVNLAVPLWSGGRRSSTIEQARISLRRSKFDAKEEKRQIILEVRQEIRNLEETRARYKTSLRAQQLAEQNYTITRDRFENGQVTARVWIEAQLSLRRTKSNALRAMIDHTLAIARYRIALGMNILPATQADQEE